jgi:hypothetical protein
VSATAGGAGGAGDAGDAGDATSCPECGAPQAPGLTCRERFGLLLAWEAQDAELAAEHFLTVAGFNLQHPAQFTDAALDGLRAAFVSRMDEGTAIAELRRRVGRAAAGSTRVLRPEAERRPVLRRWEMTVADVARPGHPSGAAGRVRTWAATIRKALEP